MLYWIYQYWNEAHVAHAAWAESFSFLRLLGYITVRAALACAFSFGLIYLFGPKVIRRLISLKVGQPIRTAAEVHKLAELHGGKAGTPTMGGVMILGAVTAAVLLCTNPLNPYVAVTSCVMLGLGLLGFMDDYAKVVKKTSDGVSGRTKLFWQALIGLVAALFLFFKPETAVYYLVENFNLVKEVPLSDVGFPLFRGMLPLGVLCIPFFMAITMGSSNAVNLADGLDGLAIGCTVTVAMAYAIIAYVTGNLNTADYLNIPFNSQIGELSIFLMALVGAGMGFLWYNCHPAKVFMGDTGSLAIGGAIGTVAICTKQELLLVIIGGVFVMEAMSVIIQVGSFKSRGKRVFAMSPIHHHFELRGWHENQVIIRFWVMSIFCALGGVALLKII